jgi:hypothetical protein
VRLGEIRNFGGGGGGFVGQPSASPQLRVYMGVRKI